MNPHGCPYAPQTYASANSATPTRIAIKIIRFVYDPVKYRQDFSNYWRIGSLKKLTERLKNKLSINQKGVYCIPRLAGKSAIVTGSGRGIGRAIALELAREGADVAVVDLVVENAASVAKEIQAMGRRSLAVQLDVTRFAEVKEVFAKIISAFGKVDILVNNAGWDKLEPFVESTEETWDKIIAINYRGMLNCTRVILDHMIARQYGKIVSISSDAGRVGSTGEAVYSSCNGAVIAFSKTLAREMARYKINVNVVCPGPTEKPLFAELFRGREKLLAAMVKAIPWGRLAKSEDIAPAVAFLASDGAGYITGQTLSVSGGLTMA